MTQLEIAAREELPFTVPDDLTETAFGTRAPRIRPHVFTAYWHLAAERQRIFNARADEPSGPWTDDPILATFKFCNSFRASDRVTQDLIRDVIYAADDLDERDLLMRIVIFRLFSRTETWRLLEREAGPLRAATFDPDRLGRILDEAMARGETLYTAAFILAPHPAFGYTRKHRNHLALVDAMLSAGVAERVRDAPSLRAVFAELMRWPMVGPFMAYQLAIDLNYSPLIDHSENAFSVAGPGAVRGLTKVFEDLNGWSMEDAIHWLVERQSDVEGVVGIKPPTLFGRTLHAIDCQNLLCEIDKYSRVAFPELLSNRRRIKQRFRPSAEPLELRYPPKWKLVGIPSNANAGSRVPSA